MGSDGTIKYSRADGTYWSFGFVTSITDPSGTVIGSTFTVVAPTDAIATLTTTSSLWTITFKNGEQRMFNAASGSLVSIIDGNGNAAQLSYDSANRMIAVADPGGRHLFFTYTDSSSYLVAGVTSDVGHSLSYLYDGQGRLTKVTRPDQSTVSFEYDSNSLITAVKDSDGKILESHTYDNLGRGLTSSRANGVDSITISYPTSTN